MGARCADCRRRVIAEVFGSGSCLHPSSRRAAIKSSILPERQLGPDWEPRAECTPRNSIRQRQPAYAEQDVLPSRSIGLMGAPLVRGGSCWRTAGLLALLGELYGTCAGDSGLGGRPGALRGVSDLAARRWTGWTA